MSDAKKDPLPLAAQLTKGIDSVDLHEFAGGIAQEMATLPQIRVGKKWYTTAQILTVLIPLGFVAGLAWSRSHSKSARFRSCRRSFKNIRAPGASRTPLKAGFRGGCLISTT